jgi:hypothetical protein
MKFKGLTNVTIHEKIPAEMTTIRTSRNQKGAGLSGKLELSSLRSQLEWWNVGKME